METNNYDCIADLYDTYVPVTFDIDFFVEETKKTYGPVLELMSGTGRVSIPLIQAGVDLTCVDFSGELNAILEEKLQRLGVRPHVYKMDVCELDLRRDFEMVIIPFHSFAHITAPDKQRKAMARIYQHLKPGGTFICTLTNPDLRSKSIDGQLRLFRKYPLPNEQGTLLLWIMESLNKNDPQVVEASQFYEEYDNRGYLVSKRLLELQFRLNRKEEFEALAEEAGFKIKALYGDYTRAEYHSDSPFMIWIMEKAA